MKLNLENLNPGVKFLIDEKNPADGSITLRLMDSKTAKEHRTATTKQRVEYHNGVRNVVNDVDDALASALFWDHIIVAWDALIDEKGKPIPCVKDMKIKLMNESPDFARMVNEKFELLVEGAAERAEEAAKN